MFIAFAKRRLQS